MENRKNNDKSTANLLPFTEKAIHIIKDIPEGKVMTYGQIAKMAGNPRAARQVARILHSMSEKYELPWHRVVNAKGQLVIKDDATHHEQRLSLEAEGIKVNHAGRINLRIYGYADNPWNQKKNNYAQPALYTTG